MTERVASGSADQRRVDQRSVISALELAAHAPSVHNSQPWRFVLGRTTVHLYADVDRWLPATDADRRDLVLSCGIVLHHMRIALAAAGIRATVHRLPNPDEPDHLAALELWPEPPADADLGLASAIPRRRTDRRRFTDWEIPRGFLDELADAAAGHGALVRHVAEARGRWLLLEAIREAAEAQAADPANRTETALWSGRVADDTGVPAANLLREPGGTSRRFTAGLLEQPEAPEEDGAALLVLGTTSDDRLSQLRAGESASAVLLRATELGLATCPLSQPLEVADTRATIRDAVLGGTLCPQLLLRVGWAPLGSEPPPTPRRPIAQVIERRDG
ncbi:Acg family FMN-binding oxidoreductase [Pseudonocardia sp.]|jgi:nitroreductase|uniref:Acg family FMN-binding oxidoreductase n=1 Tax=Pseudonocardia sp. TaxID=60912 RepID=UPI002B4B6D96|nr:NAD(P)H nitroreductase [Pseudonocardia sp.]